MDQENPQRAPSGSTGSHAEKGPAQGSKRGRDRAAGPRDGSLAWGAFLIGSGLGGLFDGILLHQVLQWHHLASGVVEDPSWNITLDGVFHAVMYALVIIGFAMVWVAGRRKGVPAGRWHAGWVLLGAGAFHLLDAFVFHWVLGLHHINPHQYVLFWDMLFFGIGLALVAVGAALVHRVRMESHGDKVTPAS